MKVYEEPFQVFVFLCSLFQGKRPLSGSARERRLLNRKYASFGSLTKSDDEPHHHTSTIMREQEEKVLEGNMTVIRVLLGFEGKGGKEVVSLLILKRNTDTDVIC